jgi:hypothetical protein
MQYSITMFISSGDLQTLSPPEFQAQILDLTIQGNPLDLLPPSFNVQSARTDSIALRMEINQKILCLASPTICNTLFMELCPGYSSQLHATLEHIHQVHTNAAGNQVVSTVQVYFKQLMSAARPFSSQRSFPVSVCQRFMDGLDPHLLTGFCCCFPDHSIVQALDGSHQRCTLQLMLKALVMPLAFLKLFRQLDMQPGPTRHWPCPARPQRHSVGIPHGEDV